MRGKRAKAIRKMAYTEGKNPPRKYKQILLGLGRIIFNDPEGPRWKYQHLKAAYRKGLFKFKLSKGRKAACGY